MLGLLKCWSFKLGFWISTPKLFSAWLDELLVIFAIVFRIPLTIFTLLMGTVAMLCCRVRLCRLLNRVEASERKLYKVWNRRVTYRWVEH